MSHFRYGLMCLNDSDDQYHPLYALIKPFGRVFGHKLPFFDPPCSAIRGEIYGEDDA